MLLLLIPLLRITDDLLQDGLAVRVSAAVADGVCTHVRADGAGVHTV